MNGLDEQAMSIIRTRDPMTTQEMADLMEVDPGVLGGTLAGLMIAGYIEGDSSSGEVRWSLGSGDRARFYRGPGKPTG